MFPDNPAREVVWLHEFQALRSRETQTQYKIIEKLIQLLSEIENQDAAMQLGLDLLARLDAKADSLSEPDQMELTILQAIAKAGSGRTFADRLDRLKESGSARFGEQVEATRIRLLFEADKKTEALDTARRALGEELYDYVGAEVRAIAYELASEKDPRAGKWESLLRDAE